ETVLHFMLECPAYTAAHYQLIKSLGRGACSLPFLLSHSKAIPEVLKYVNVTTKS
ncbi:hypothetical protein SERLA73DRAFT_62931, partial [Serpula lacrymans var. lacrymans S7.3]